MLSILIFIYDEWGYLVYVIVAINVLIALFYDHLHPLLLQNMPCSYHSSLTPSSLYWGQPVQKPLCSTFSNSLRISIHFFCNKRSSMLYRAWSPTFYDKFIKVLMRHPKIVKAKELRPPNVSWHRSNCLMSFDNRNLSNFLIEIPQDSWTFFHCSVHPPTPYCLG